MEITAETLWHLALNQGVAWASLAWLRSRNMKTVNMLEAKSSLSRLVQAVEEGSEDEIIIARSGRPAARLVAIRPSKTGQRIGVAKGKFIAPANIDADNAVVAALFTGSAE